MRLLFLDRDGVANDHVPLPSGYCGVLGKGRDALNHILASVPDAQIVITSAWRYACLNRWMTIEGFEFMLLTHGVCCRHRILAHTEADPEEFKEEDHRPPYDVEKWRQAGLRWRADQIRQTVEWYSPDTWVVLDDLPLVVENLVQTDPSVGLTMEQAEAAIAILMGQNQ